MLLLSRANLMVHQVASKDSMDRGLDCVHVNPDGSTVAGSRKTLMAVGPAHSEAISFPEVGEGYDIEGGVNIPLDTAVKAIKNLSTDKRTALQHVALTRPHNIRKLELTAVDAKGNAQRTEGTPMPGGFQDWQAVIRKARGGEERKHILVRRSDIIALLKAIDQACPDKGTEDLLFIEIGEANGIVLRSRNHASGQQVIGCMSGYTPKEGKWLPNDKWEDEVLGVRKARRRQK